MMLGSVTGDTVCMYGDNVVTTCLSLSLLQGTFSLIVEAWHDNDNSTGKSYSLYLLFTLRLISVVSDVLLL